MTEFKNNLKEGTVLHGTHYDYTIVKTERQDGFGINYLVSGAPVGKRKPSGPLSGLMPKHGKLFTIREHFMFHCSHRGADGAEVITPDDALSTVEDFKNIFDVSTPWSIEASKGRDSLLQIVDFFQANGTSYYVTELLEGPTLYDYIMTNGPVDIERAREILTPMLLAVRYLHTQHMLHTDLSPHSIIMAHRADGSLRPVLTRHYGCKPFVDRAEAGWQLPPMSCPDIYAPLEQYGEMDKFLPQTNVYSLAAILTFMLCGKEPPAAQDVTEETVRSMLPDSLPPLFVQELVKAMSPDWHDRHIDISDFRAGLINSQTDDRKMREQLERELHPDRKRNRSLTPVLIGIMLAICFLAVVLLLYSET